MRPYLCRRLPVVQSRRRLVVFLLAPPRQTSQAAAAIRGVGSAARDSLSSPSVADCNGEQANITDALDNVAAEIHCLTKALNRQADALQHLVEAVHALGPLNRK